MKKKNILLVSLIFGFYALSNVSAYEASALLSESIYSELKEKGKVGRSLYKSSDFTPQYVPDTELSKKAVSFWTNSNKPVFMVENLYLIPKSEFGSGDVSKTNIDYASKVLRSVSKMQGMKYYSTRNKKWETLYKEAYSIRGPKDRTRVPDDTEGNAEGKILYCMQNDNSFGKTNYRLEYHQSQTEVSAAFVNTTGLYVGPIKGVDNNNLRINIVIMDCGDDMLIYMLVRAKFPALSILEKTMNESFSSRLDAIYKWFLEQF